jgi:hypothetical protein
MGICSELARLIAREDFTTYMAFPSSLKLHYLPKFLIYDIISSQFDSRAYIQATVLKI